MDGWTQTLSAGTLLGIAAAAILLILILIVKLRVHALLTLVLVSLLTAIVTGLPMGSIVNDVLVKNFGGTLGSVALLVGFGAMLGRLVETSGGAQSLADALIRIFGDVADCVCNGTPYEADRSTIRAGVYWRIFGHARLPAASSRPDCCF